MPVYRKLGDANIWLMYNPIYKNWYVQPTSSKGTNNCHAYFACDPPCLPEKGAKRTWQVADGSVFYVQIGVDVSIVTPQEVAVEAQRLKTIEEMEARRRREQQEEEEQKISRSKIIKHASGEHAKRVNGIYEFTREISCGMPVYRKQDMMLLYHAGNKQWHITDEAGRRNGGAYALSVTGEVLPDNYYNAWQMHNGSAWVKSKIRSIAATPAGIQIVRDAEMAVAERVRRGYQIFVKNARTGIILNLHVLPTDSIESVQLLLADEVLVVYQRLEFNNDDHLERNPNDTLSSKNIVKGSTLMLFVGGFGRLGQLFVKTLTGKVYI